MESEYLYTLITVFIILGTIIYPINLIVAFAILLKNTIASGYKNIDKKEILLSPEYLTLFLT